MRQKTWFFILTQFLMAVSISGTFLPSQKAELSNGLTIEYRIARPKEKSFPLLLILHGASFTGLDNIPESWSTHWLKKGYGLLQISMPGFGNSTGKRDFCGPQTIDSLNAIIDVLKPNPNYTRLGIIAFGQGSLASALLGARRDDISCMVLANGGYNLLRHMHPEDPLVNQLRYYDMAVSEAEMKIRSPMEYAHLIKAPTYLLHRVSNPIIRSDEVLQFCEALTKNGVECRVSLLERIDEEDQKVSYDEILHETEKWVDKHMRA